MRTGKLSISRGYLTEDGPPAAPRLTLVPREPAPAAAEPLAFVAPTPRPAPPKTKPAATPVSPEFQPAHDRLVALERLARLAKQGALTPEEFALEKARILAHPFVEPAPAAGPAFEPRPPTPSLAGRMFGWKFLPVTLAAGLGLSFATQPRETFRFFEEAMRLLGA